MSGKPYASASARNAAPILSALRHEFRAAASVLEIGYGTGQHAVTFATELDHLSWQTSDLQQSHDGIKQWIAEAGLSNVLQPIALDVLTVTAMPASYDAVFSANTAHIMSYAAVCRMFEFAATALPEQGVFFLYGPFSRDGVFSTSSNAAFDESLRARNAAMGIRDLDDLDAMARRGGMSLLRIYAMPTNNLAAVWRKRGDDECQ